MPFHYLVHLKGKCNMKQECQIKKTKRLVADAFFSLLSIKSFDDITLAEIEDKAGVSRMTIHR